MQIRIENLTKSYGKNRGIIDINLQLPDRSLTAIVGPSGCGKTTLLRILAGLLEPDSGKIWFGNEDMTHSTPQQRGAAMVFQNYALWPHMSVFDNVAYGLKLRKVPAKEIEWRVYDILQRVEIDTKDIKKRYPQQYSGGQQQRIALARALVVQPNLLLMDEPLSNLDAKVRQRLRVEIRNIQQSFGITALYVTHDQEEALSMADYVVVMNEGRIEQAGTPKEVYHNPATYFAAHFLGESHTLHVNRAGKAVKLVIRSNDVRIGARIEAVSNSEHGLPGRPEVIEEQDCFTLRGEVTDHLFIGHCFRHMVKVGEQSFFADAETECSPGMYLIHIPKEKAFWFDDAQERKEVMV
jgi:ABC-type Fe3+/spermidine/putrescine transport system ATPase subunit